MAGEEERQESETARVRYPTEEVDEIEKLANKLYKIAAQEKTALGLIEADYFEGKRRTYDNKHGEVLGHLASVARNVAGLNQKVFDAQKALEKAQQKVTDYDDLEKMLKESEGTAGKVKSAEERAKKADALLAQLKKGYDAVPGRLGSVDDALAELKKGLGSVAGRLDAVDSGLAGLKQGQEGLHEDGELIYTSLAELAQAQEALQRGQEALKQGNSTITMGIAELEACHDERKGEHKELLAGQKETSKEVADFRRTYERQTLELYKAVFEGRISILTALGNTKEVLLKEMLKVREKEMEGRVRLLEGQVDIMKYVFDAQKDTSARIDSLGDFLRGQYRQMPSPGTGYDRGPGGTSGGGAPEQDTGKEKQAAPREEPSASIDDTVSKGDDSAKAETPDAPGRDANQLYNDAVKARKEGNYEQVLPLLQEAYAEGFDKPYLLNCELGTFLLLTGNFDAAEHAFLGLMKNKDISEEARIVAEHNLGCIYEERDDDFEKADKLRLVEDDDPGFWHFRGDFGSASGNSGAYREAA